MKYSIGSPTSSCDSLLNRTPPELRFLVSVVRPTWADPVRTSSIGSRRSNLCDLRCSGWFITLTIYRVLPPVVNSETAFQRTCSSGTEKRTPTNRCSARGLVVRLPAIDFLHRIEPTITQFLKRVANLHGEVALLFLRPDSAKPLHFDHWANFRHWGSSSIRLLKTQIGWGFRAVGRGTISTRFSSSPRAERDLGLRKSVNSRRKNIASTRHRGAEGGR